MEKNNRLALDYERTGEAYYYGRGKRADPDKAKEYFQRAVQCGEGELKAEALCNLALLTKDPYAKLTMYLEAADEGCAEAMNMVGVCMERYHIGIAATRVWYRKAAEAGSPSGMYNYALQRRKAKEKIKWLGRAAELGHEPSARLLEEVQAEYEAELAEKRERVKALLDAAQDCKDDPAAIIYLPRIPLVEMNHMASDAAEVLKKSVVLLTDGYHESSRVKCVGYDFNEIGLAQAMENPYSIDKCWSFGHFTSGTVFKEHMYVYMDIIRQRLSKPETK